MIDDSLTWRPVAITVNIGQSNLASVVVASAYQSLRKQNFRRTCPQNTSKITRWSQWNGTMGRLENDEIDVQDINALYQTKYLPVSACIVDESSLPSRLTRISALGRAKEASSWFIEASGTNS